jgi:hypothetical protein
LFEANFSSILAIPFATIAAVLVGKSKGISAEHLSKVWGIPHEDAARTLQVTTQRLRHDADSSLSRNFDTNDKAVRYKKLKSYFFSDTLFVTGKDFLFRTRVLLPSIQCSINVIISWRSDNLRRRWEHQRSLFAILIQHKHSKKPKSFVPKLGQHTGFWKPELNGQTALSYMLA